MKIVRRAAWVPVALGILLPGCDPGISHQVGMRRGQMRLDLSSLQADGSAVSVAESATLQVTPEGERPRPRDSQPLGRGVFEAVFGIENVPAGATRFVVEVLNRAGEPLLRGDTTVPVERDDFAVEVPLGMLGPFLVVRPDSVEPREIGLGALEGGFTLHSLGIEPFEWRVVDAVPAASGGEELARCGPALLPCLFLSQDGGTLGPPGPETHLVRLRAVSAEEQDFLLRLDSGAGELDVRMRVPAAFTGTAPATVDVDGSVDEAEWSGAARIDFSATLFDGSLTPGTFRIMNGADSLYVALTLVRDADAWEREGYRLGVRLDDDADGATQSSEDAFAALTPHPFDSLGREYVDGTDLTVPPCTGPWDSFPLSTPPAEAQNGRARVGFDGTTVTMEAVKPLSGPDPDGDVALRAGQAVGFHFCLNLYDRETPDRETMVVEWPGAGASAVFVVR